MINEVTDLILTTLESLGIEVHLKDTVPDTLPSTYATFWNVETRKTSKYNNRYNSCIFRFYVTFYSTDPRIVNDLVDRLDDMSTSDMFLETFGNDYYVNDKDYTGRTVVLRYIWRDFNGTD